MLLQSNAGNILQQTLEVSPGDSALDGKTFPLLKSCPVYMIAGYNN